MGLQQKSVVLHKIYIPYAYLGGDGRTDGRKIFTQYSGISSCSLGSTYTVADTISRLEYNPVSIKQLKVILQQKPMEAQKDFKDKTG